MCGLEAGRHAATSWSSARNVTFFGILTSSAALGQRAAAAGDEAVTGEGAAVRGVSRHIPANRECNIPRYSYVLCILGRECSYSIQGPDVG